MNGLFLIVLKAKIGNFLMQFHRFPLKRIFALHSAAFARLIDCYLDGSIMSRTPPRLRPQANSTIRVLLCGAAMIAAVPPAAHAQYVGHIDTNQDNKTPTLRATAVLEYTGDVTKPNAALQLAGFDVQEAVPHRQWGHLAVAVQGD